MLHHRCLQIYLRGLKFSKILNSIPISLEGRFGSRKGMGLRRVSGMRWGQFVIAFERPWGAFRMLLGALGTLLGHLGAPLGTLGSLFGYFSIHFFIPLLHFNDS